MSKTFKTIFKKATLSVASDPRTLQVVGEVLVSSAQRSIDVGGRFKAAGSFEGGSKKFAPLTPFSAAFKAAKGKNATNLLRESGRLRSSITYEVRGNKLLVGSNVVYAGIHQFGGRIRITPKSRAFFKFKAGSAKKPAEREFWQRMAGNKNGFLMPARPFITIQREDLEDIAELMAMAMKKQLV